MWSSHAYDSFCNIIKYDYDYLALLTNVIEYWYVFSKKVSMITTSTITEYAYSISGLDCL